MLSSLKEEATDKACVYCPAPVGKHNMKDEKSGILETGLTESSATKIVIFKVEEPNMYRFLKILGNNEDFIVIQDCDTSAEMKEAFIKITQTKLPVYITMLRWYDYFIPLEGIRDICDSDEIVEIIKGSAEWYDTEETSSANMEEKERYVLGVSSQQLKGQLIFVVNSSLDTLYWEIEDKILADMKLVESRLSTYDEKRIPEVLKGLGLSISNTQPLLADIIEAICVRNGWTFELLAHITKEDWSL